MDVESGGSPWDLYVAFIDQPEGIVGRIQYNPDMFQVSRIKQGVQDFQSLLELLITNPGLQLASLNSFALPQTQGILSTTAR